MHPDTYPRLDELGIPRPLTFTVTELLALEGVELVLVRGAAGRGRPAFLTPADAAAWILASGDPNLLANEAIGSDSGGCAVKQAGGVYLELVDGHVSGLLRDGWCQYRAWATPQEFRLVRVTQQDAVDFASLEPAIRPARAIPEETIRQVLSQVRPHIDRLPLNTLTEFILTPDLQPLFVDLKPYHWAIRFALLFDDSSEPWLYGETSDPISAWIRCPRPSTDAESLTDATGIMLDSGAALSHFVSYGLQAGRVSAIRT